jgi:hypothetical protein
VVDRSHLAGQISSRDDVDARQGQEQNVRRACQSGGKITFQGLNFQGFAATIVLKRQRDGVMDCGCQLGRRGGFRPGQHFPQGALLIAHLGFFEAGLQAGQPGLLDGLRCRKLADDTPGDGAVPEVFKAGRETGEACFEVLTDLAAELARLAHEVAALPDA